MAAEPGFGISASVDISRTSEFQPCEAVVTKDGGDMLRYLFHIRYGDSLIRLNMWFGVLEFGVGL